MASEWYTIVLIVVFQMLDRIGGGGECCPSHCGTHLLTSKELVAIWSDDKNWSSKDLINCCAEKWF
jgi:hypothetical protein